MESIHITVNGKRQKITADDWIISDAKALLQHTNWNIVDIAYALGFD